MIRRLWDALRTVVAGVDPARPVPVRPRWLAPVGVVALVGFAAIVTQNLRDDRAMPLIIAMVLGVLSVLPILLLWRSPLWAWRVGLAGLVAGTIDAPPDAAWPWNAVQTIVPLVVLLVIALREPLPVVVLTAAITLVATWILVDGDNAGGVAVLVAAVLVIGYQIQIRRRAQTQLRAQTERTRLARELHDVVAHSMSLVAVRAETAPYRLPDLPEAARAEFAALAATARESLTEMRRLLGVLRTASGPELTPQPTLSDLDDLIASVRHAGFDVSYLMGTKPAATVVPTVYRILQEALSNAGRHAPSAGVVVRVERAGKDLMVLVRNDPSPSGAASDGPGGGGHGLTGMRERVELLNGTMHAGPTPEGGYEVKVLLPEGYVD